MFTKNGWTETLYFLSSSANLADIAKSSNAQSNHNPTQPQAGITGSANRRPEEILDTAARSSGTESGTGAYSGGIVNQAGTDSVPDQ